MKLISAGILVYRKSGSGIEVLLIHPGGPYFTNKDKGAWGIPKGLVFEGESLEAAAQRELEEETGVRLPETASLANLGTVKMKSGKIIHGFAAYLDLPGNWKPVSNIFKTEWPPKSGKMQEFPETDQAKYFEIETAKDYMNARQSAFLDKLIELLS